MSGIEIEMDDPSVVQAQPPPPSLPRPAAPSRPEDESTFYWAVEIERSLVALIWHHPEYLAPARRELDFGAHFSVPAHRRILEAISLVHGEIGELDFTCVVHAVRELGAFDECGQSEGLNEIYTDGGRSYDGHRHPEIFFREYVRLLKMYGAARRTDPFTTVRRYTSGRGHLQRNKLATRPTHPAVVGKIRRCCCGKRCTIAGWPGEEGTLNLTLTPER
jgi:DnaB-like helicase N terminal domain